MSRILGLAALLAVSGPVLACGDEEVCGSLARLCADPGRWRILATDVQDGVVLDFDGDGEDEGVALSRSGWKLALGHAGGQFDGWRLMLHFDAEPVGLEALSGELAVAFTEPPLVAIFGVDGGGRLERRRDIALSSSPAALRSHDLDGDGAPELLATLPATGRLAVVDPTSGEVREYAAGSQPSELAVGDVDGDARSDVVVVDAPAAALAVLRGAGDRTLTRPTQSLSSPTVLWLELADHDGDGDLDAVTRDSMSTVFVHHNDGGGRFSSPLALPLAGAEAPGAGLAVGPVADGGLVGVSVPQGKMLRTWFGKGAAWLGHIGRGFVEPAWWVGAGRDDLVLVGGSSYLARHAWQPSAAALEVWRSDEASAYVENEVALATGDLDDDHLLDFAAAAQGTLHLFHGRADRGFERRAQFELEERATAMVIADVTGDGRSEIVINEDTHVRALFRGDDGQYVAGPRFEPAVSPRALVPLRTGPNQPSVIVATPRPPFALARTPGASLLRFAPDGAVTLDVLTDELFVDGLVAVDVDEDGVDEPLIVGRRDGDMVLTRMTSDGAGFSPGPEHVFADFSEVTPDPNSFRFFAAGDVDGDGGPEVFVDAPEGRLRIAGLADDAPQATFEPVHAPTVLRDVDSDGLLDTVFLHLHQFHYQHGHGDGTFAAETRGHNIQSATKMVFAPPGAQFDLVALGSEAVSTHLVRPAVQPGWAAPPVVFSGPASAFASGDLDLDGDGRYDLAVAGEEKVSVWLRGEDGPRRVQLLEAPVAIVAVDFPDVDGDDRPDFVALAASGNMFVRCTQAAAPPRPETMP
ncbi:VCBS repeat-containing protein [Nannocystis sp. SCPEA4]|uniref:FG-GAP repeat domain-containing protein n=1 Tax=Nannocystis sp. SCPEA4 TaxID=2996787 RepID=UPI002270EF5F|nr:VCBS repeat-containing protein [Nannocystis sp. SCPEA4]MCY1059411.1 VCBS repeat-containing protein [Nannocystis sp. SCPEA4]